MHKKKQVFVYFFIVFLVFPCIPYSNNGSSLNPKKGEAQMDTIRQEQLDAIRSNLKKGDVISAVSLAESYLKKNPNDVEVMGLLAACKLQPGKVVETQDLIKKIIAIDPKNADAYKLLAQSYRTEAETTQVTQEKKEGLFESARKAIERAILLNPNNPWIKVEGAIIYRNGGNKTKGLELIKEAYKTISDDRSIKELKEEMEANQ